jgi:formylglycine-generating enzyme required for sulfatase activity
MARVTALLALALLAPAACAQSEEDAKFRQAGVCARCHVISVVEWGISGHQKVKTDCVACHGASEGHVADERNNIKPEKVPHADAIAGLCANCHVGGCPNSKQKAGCQQCHHVHALIDPNKPAVAKDIRHDEILAHWQNYEERMKEGERLAAAAQWGKAGEQFRAALSEKPGDAAARERAKMCERRMKGIPPGFEMIGKEYDEKAGLPLRVKVAGIGIPMVLVAGGEFEMGSEKFVLAKPVTTVRVAPFYLAQYEMTQQEWQSLMGTNPSAHQGAKFPESARMPVEQVSWQDCREMLERLNAKAAGGGFRLPTEAEWEFAARAGEAISPAGEAGAPKPVGQGTASKLGLYDMQGNVWEWTSSLAKPYPYDGEDGREDAGAAGLRVLRGGGFEDAAIWYDPGARHTERATRRLRSNGVRLARSVAE